MAPPATRACAQGEGRHGQVGAGGQVVAVELLEDLVDRSQIGDVGEHPGEADDVVEGVVDSLDDGPEVGEALPGLLCDAAGHEFAGGRRDGQLGRWLQWEKATVCEESPSSSGAWEMLRASTALLGAMGCTVSIVGFDVLLRIGAVIGLYTPRFRP